jgi:CRP-like cAMP-binding protein
MLIGGVYLDRHGALNSIHESPLVRKLRAFVALSGAELGVLQRLHQRRRTFAAGHPFLHQGHSQRSAFILASGWVCSYKTLPSGTRQIVDFQVPGDFLGLRSVLLQTSDHFIEAVTRVEVSEVLPEELLDAFRETPRLAAAVLWAASRDEAMIVEHLIDIGRRSAEERVAHFLLEMGFRLSLVGLGDKSGYACPLSQFHLADALGLSAVHVNRVLRKLREDGMVTFRGGKVTFDNFEALVAFADFDTAYLDQERPLLK